MMMRNNISFLQSMNGYIAKKEELLIIIMAIIKYSQLAKAIQNVITLFDSDSESLSLHGSCTAPQYFKNCFFLLSTRSILSMSQAFKGFFEIVGNLACLRPETMERSSLLITVVITLPTSCTSLRVEWEQLVNGTPERTYQSACLSSLFTCSLCRSQGIFFSHAISGVDEMVPHYVLS